MFARCSTRRHTSARPRAQACLGRSRTQLLLGLSLLAAAGTVWIPTPTTPMHMVPGSTLAVPDQPQAPNPSPSSADVRLTRA